MDEGSSDYEAIDNAARILGLLAEPARLKVVAALTLGNNRVSSIAAASGLSNREVVRSLSRLATAGLVIEENGSYELVAQELKDAARHIAALRPEEEVDGSPDVVKILRSFVRGGKLVSIPTSSGKRAVVLDHIAQVFEPGRKYLEKEVNAELAKWHGDYASLRRYLVDEEFMSRDRGIYWRSGGEYPLT
jgi:hypothetical protein